MYRILVAVIVAISVTACSVNINKSKTKPAVKPAEQVSQSAGFIQSIALANGARGAIRTSLYW